MRGREPLDVEVIFLMMHKRLDLVHTFWQIKQTKQTNKKQKQNKKKTEQTNKNKNSLKLNYHNAYTSSNQMYRLFCNDGKR